MTQFEVLLRMRDDHGDMIPPGRSCRPPSGSG